MQMRITPKQLDLYEIQYYENNVSVVPRIGDKVVCVMHCRLASRPGKNIPDHVMQNMIAGLQMPTSDEGFDEIVTL